MTTAAKFDADVANLITRGPALIADLALALRGKAGPVAPPESGRWWDRFSDYEVEAVARSRGAHTHQSPGGVVVCMCRRPE